MPRLKRGNRGRAVPRKRTVPNNSTNTSEDAFPPPKRPNVPTLDVIDPQDFSLPLTPVQDSQQESISQSLPSHYRGSISQCSAVFDPPSMGKQCAGCALSFFCFMSAFPVCSLAPRIVDRIVWEGDKIFRSFRNDQILAWESNHSINVDMLHVEDDLSSTINISVFGNDYAIEPHVNQPHQEDM